VLLTISKRHDESGLLRDAVWSIRLFGVAVPEILLAKWRRSVLWVGTRCAYDDELLKAVVAPRLFDNVKPHGHILEEEPPGIVAVCPYAANGCSQMNQHLRLRIDI